MVSADARPAEKKKRHTFFCNQTGLTNGVRKWGTYRYEFVVEGVCQVVLAASKIYNGASRIKTENLLS